VTVTSFKTVKLREGELIKTEFSDGSELSISTVYLPEGIEAVFQENKELTLEEEEAFKFAALCYGVEKAALRYIARAEQNSLFLTAKLERKHPELVVKKVISHLLDLNLINNERYAELWVRSRLSQGKSPRWLLASLGKRGINRNSSLNALKKVLDPETEYKLLLKYFEKIGVGEQESAAIPRARLKSEGFSNATLDRNFCIL